MEIFFPVSFFLASIFKYCTVGQFFFRVSFILGLINHMDQMRMDPKHQFAAQFVLSRAANERREREALLAAAAVNMSHFAMHAGLAPGLGGSPTGHSDSPTRISTPAEMKSEQPTLASARSPLAPSAQHSHGQPMLDVYGRMANGSDTTLRVNTDTNHTLANGQPALNGTQQHLMSPNLHDPHQQQHQAIAPVAESVS